MVNLHGVKIEEDSSSYMKGRNLLIILSFAFSSLYGVQHSRYAFEELKLSMEDVQVKLRNQKGELELIYERIANLENENYRLNQKLQQLNSDAPLSQLNKKQEACIKDLKLLKEALQKTQKQLSLNENSLTVLEKKWGGDLKELKQSIQSVVALLEEEEMSSYVVQNGDNLGAIALKFHTSVKEIKKINQLSNDIIHTGQKLQIPKKR